MSNVTHAVVAPSPSSSPSNNRQTGKTRGRKRGHSTVDSYTAAATTVSTPQRQSPLTVPTAKRQRCEVCQSGDDYASLDYFALDERPGNEIEVRKKRQEADNFVLIGRLSPVDTFAKSCFARSLASYNQLLRKLSPSDHRFWDTLLVRGQTYARAANQFGDDGLFYRRAIEDIQQVNQARGGGHELEIARIRCHLIALEEKRPLLYKWNVADFTRQPEGYSQVIKAYEQRLALDSSPLSPVDKAFYGIAQRRQLNYTRPGMVQEIIASADAALGLMREALRDPRPLDAATRALLCIEIAYAYVQMDEVVKSRLACQDALQLIDDSLSRSNVLDLAVLERLRQFAEYLGDAVMVTSAS